MKTRPYHLIYDTEFIPQLKSIERKYHAIIKEAIRRHLIYEADKKTNNRKPLTRTTSWGARWELHCGNDNEFRVFYSVYTERSEVHILAVGIKQRERLFIGGKEVEL